VQATWVVGAPGLDDAADLAELRRDPSAANAFSLYLRGKVHHEAIITVTEEGDLVLGVGLDDPYNDPRTHERARDDLHSMIAEFQATAGIGGVELAPPQSLTEWRDDGLVMFRVGNA